MRVLLSKLKGDRTIWFVVMILSVISILAVYSSTGTLAFKYQSGNTEYYIIKHMFIYFLAFGLMYVCHRIPYYTYKKWASIALFVTIPLLLLTLLRGSNINEASRWLTLPIINLSFQTSDFAKVALILYVARVLSSKQDDIKDFKSAFLPIMLPVVVVCGLILPANFSTSAVLFMTCLVIMFIGRINIKYLASLIGIGVLTFSLFLGIAYLTGYKGRIETWNTRIESYFNGKSDSNYQVEQGKIAIATGGLIGKGPGNSTQRNFLPHPYSDFIFAIIIEEYGFVGGGAVVFLYLLLFYRAMQIVKKSDKAFASFIAVGCAFSLVFQAMINMLVAVSLLPVTGQPLPMLSMGGTSIWFTSIAIGIILSVSCEIEKPSSKQENNEVATA
jgi:cell division protein FtsW